MPKADATELAPKKSAASPSHVPDRAWEGLSFRTEKKQKNLHFFGEAPERRPWAIKCEDRPAAFAGRSFAFPGLGYPSAYMGEYPIPIRCRPLCTGRRSVHVIVRDALEEIVRISRETIVANYSSAGRKIIRT